MAINKILINQERMAHQCQNLIADRIREAIYELMRGNFTRLVTPIQTLAVLVVCYPVVIVFPLFCFIVIAIVSCP